MISIVIRPVKDAKTVNYENLYVAEAGGINLCQVRAKTAQHAEAKLMECFKHELVGKTVDFNLEAWLESQKDKGEEKKV